MTVPVNCKKNLYPASKWLITLVEIKSESIMEAFHFQSIKQKEDRMKRTTLEIVRYLLGRNIYKLNTQMTLHGDEHVDFERNTAKRYKQYY